MTKITRNDFMRGIIYYVTIRQVHSIHVGDERFYQAVLESYHSLINYAQDNHIDVDFSVKLDHIYGEDAHIFIALRLLEKEGLLILDDKRKIAVINISIDTAYDSLKDLPGDEEIYEICADALLSML